MSATAEATRVEQARQLAGRSLKLRESTAGPGARFSKQRSLLVSHVKCDPEPENGKQVGVTYTRLLAGVRTLFRARHALRGPILLDVEVEARERSTCSVVAHPSGCQRRTGRWHP